MKQAHVLTEKEKRQYFRIDDLAVLQYRQVSEQEVMQSEYKPEQQAMCKLTMMAQFENMTRELQTLSKVIAKSQSTVANCIEMIDRKVNMIGEFLVANEMAKMEVEPQYVNIGAGGLSFSSSNPIITGAMLEVRMVLLPAHTGIFSYARVINCQELDDPEAADGYQFRVAIEFVNMEEEVRDLITRHVLAKEREQMMQERGG